MSTDLLTRDSLAERQGSVRDYISPSRLNLWLKCPLAFRLKYIDGIKPPTSPSLFVGKMCHAALECHYRHRQLGVTIEPPELLRRLLESWDQAAADEALSFESAAAEDACRSQAVGLVGAYLAQLLSDEPKPLAVEAAVEAPLVDPTTGENLGIPLVGIMDLVLPGPDGPVIADFKTTARGGEPLEIAHEIQLSSYSYLFRESSQQMESALEIRNLIKTKTPKIETHRYAARDERHFRRLFRVIRAYLDDLDAGRFVFRPGFGCSMCDFRDTHCREWGG
jgi:putative RecB family exonuclease